jgi:hypothetical protein
MIVKNNHYLQRRPQKYAIKMKFRFYIYKISPSNKLGYEWIIL